MKFIDRRSWFHRLRAIGSRLSAFLVPIFRPVWVQTLVVIVIYLAFSWAGVAVGMYVAHSNLIWPANGVLLGILLFSKRERWGIYLAGTAVASAILHIYTHFPTGRSIVYAFANVAEIYPAAVLIRWGEDRRPDLSRLPVLGRFLAAIAIAPMFSAAVVKAGSYIVQYGIKYDGIRSWYFADVLGLAIMTPLVLAIRRSKLYELLRDKPAESLSIWALTAVFSILISGQSIYPITFFFFPLLLLAVFRLGLTGSAISIILLAVPADYFALQLRGAFAILNGEHFISGVLLLQIYLLTLIATVWLVGSALAENDRLRDHLADSHQRMEELAGTDALTQLANRRTFDKRISDEWNRAVREKTTLSLLMVDVDHFKAYNDRYGHLAGDELLREIAQVMTTLPHRAMDLICRYGGEEFAIILPNTDTGGAMLFAERLRYTVASMRRTDADGELRQITVSVGIASIKPRSRENFMEFQESADKALYSAKAAGRNVVRVSGPVECKVAE